MPLYGRGGGEKKGKRREEGRGSPLPPGKGVRGQFHSFAFSYTPAPATSEKEGGKRGEGKIDEDLAFRADYTTRRKRTHPGRSCDLRLSTDAIASQKKKRRKGGRRKKKKRDSRGLRRYRRRLILVPPAPDNLLDPADSRPLLRRKEKKKKKKEKIATHNFIRRESALAKDRSPTSYSIGRITNPLQTTKQKKRKRKKKGGGRKKRHAGG